MTTTTNHQKQYLSIEEMCELLSISRTQFWRLRKDGKIAAPVIDHPPRWKRDQIESKNEVTTKVTTQ